MKENLNFLLAKKMDKDKKESSPIKFKCNGIEEELMINPLSAKVILDIEYQHKKHNKTDDAMWQLELVKKTVYEAIPELHDNELLESCNATDNPPSVVDAIFTQAEMTEIYSKLVDVVTSVDIKEIKN